MELLPYIQGSMQWRYYLKHLKFSIVSLQNRSMAVEVTNIENIALKLCKWFCENQIISIFAVMLLLVAKYVIGHSRCVYFHSQKHGIKATENKISTYMFLIALTKQV